MGLEAPPTDFFRSLLDPGCPRAPGGRWCGTGPMRGRRLGRCWGRPRRTFAIDSPLEETGFEPSVPR